MPSLSRLLSFPLIHAQVLIELGTVSRKLGNLDLALKYLEDALSRLTHVRTPLQKLQLVKALIGTRYDRIKFFNPYPSLLDKVIHRFHRGEHTGYSWYHLQDFRPYHLTVLLNSSCVMIFALNHIKLEHRIVFVF